MHYLFESQNWPLLTAIITPCLISISLRGKTHLSLHGHYAGHRVSHPRRRREVRAARTQARFGGIRAHEIPRRLMDGQVGHGQRPRGHDHHLPRDCRWQRTGGTRLRRHAERDDHDVF